MHLALNGWFWNSPTTGSGHYIRQLAKALADGDADMQITVVVPSGGRRDCPGSDLDLAPSCALQPIPCGRSNLAKVQFEQTVFPRACGRLGADVAHVPYWAPPVRSPVPLVVTIHDLIPLVMRHYRGGPLQRLYTALVGATARGAALVLTDSDASRSDILQKLGLSEKRVRVVPLAADDRYGPEPHAEDTTIRAACGLPDRYILYLGGFDRRKNLAVVLAAYGWAGPAIGEECRLVIAGRLPDRDSPFAPDPRRLMREMNVPDELVHLIGFVAEKDKPAVYRGAVAFIFPSRYEGFGLPPLEAQACGTPVVASDAGSLPEIVGDAGILLPPDDARGMGGMLIQLALDDRFRADMSGRAVAQAARFSWERTAEATRAAYRDVRE